MVFTVRDFVFQMYSLITPSNPTVPLHGPDQELAIQVLNQLMQSFASTGLMLTIAKTVSVGIDIGTNTVRLTDPDYPTGTTVYENVNLTGFSFTFTVTNGLIYNVGDIISGNGIQPDTTITAIATNTITISNYATFTGASLLGFEHLTPIAGIVFIQEGRLANLDSAWMLLNGVTYPMIDKSRDDFLASWKYDPLQGLPRFVIVYPQTQYVDIRLYPGPSQFFEFFVRGKFQFPPFTANSDLSSLPQYYIRYLLFAVAKDVSMYKGRSSAWTPILESMLREAQDIMEASSEVNLSITGDEQSLLNGAWRVRAGI